MAGMTRMMGYWIDLDNPYKTLTNDYIETVWWILNDFYKKGLIYKGHKISALLPQLRYTALQSWSSSGIPGNGRSVCLHKNSKWKMKRILILSLDHYTVDTYLECCSCCSSGCSLCEDQAQWWIPYSGKSPFGSYRRGIWNSGGIYRKKIWNTKNMNSFSRSLFPKKKLSM